MDVVIVAKLLILPGDMRRHVASHDFRTVVRAKHRFQPLFICACVEPLWQKRRILFRLRERWTIMDLFRFRNYLKVGI